MRCPNCNEAYSSKFCPGCGYCAQPDVPSTQNKPTTATTTTTATAPTPPPAYRPSTAYQPQPIIINNNIGSGVVARALFPKNRWLAFFLCFFLGYLGAHRFYVGKIGTGILYLFTGGLFGIGAIIDLFMILFGAFTDRVGNRLSNGN